MSNLRKFVDNYDRSRLEFPVSIEDIREYEIKNDISVNVLAVEGRDIYIHKKGRWTETNYREINLLLISEGSTGPASADGIKHYTAIKSLSRLLRSSNTKHKCKQYLCTNCLQSFTLESSRDEHQVYCEDNETIRVEMPHKGSTTEFKVPFMTYADFEAILKPIQGPRPKRPCKWRPDPEESYTTKVNQHIPSGWCVYSTFA